MDPDKTTIPPGRRFGPYVLADALAEGGMGRVHLAVRVGSAGFRRVVAIKRARPDLSSAEYQQMFRSEIDLLSHVVHPNVVAALDVFRAGSETFLVLEYVHGESLGDVLYRVEHSESIVPLRIAAAIASDLLRGLHATHEAESPSGEKLNLVHRDVAPDNIVVGSDGVARILDFGIATSSSRPGTTKVGYLKGKAPYLAPERLYDGKIDRRVDIYGAGVVLWEALTGKKLFDGEDAAVMTQVAAGNIAAPSSVVAEIPPEMDEIVLRAVARNPGERFETALDMLLALRPYCADTSEVAAWLEVVAGDSLARKARLVRQLTLKSTNEETAARKPVVVQRRRPWRMAAFVSAFALAGGLVAWQLGDGTTAQASAASAHSHLPFARVPEVAVPPPPSPEPEPEVAAAIAPALVAKPAPAPTVTTKKQRAVRVKKRAPSPAPQRVTIDDGF